MFLFDCVFVVFLLYSLFLFVDIIIAIIAIGSRECGLKLPGRCL